MNDEVVVYDLDNDFVHLLNATTAAVWQHCDGKTSVSAIAKATTLDEAIVLDALAQLQTVSLLDAPIDVAPTGLSRRQMLKTIGIAAAAIPVVTTVLAPTPAAAASVGSPIGASCHSSQNGGNCECASGYCNKGTSISDYCYNTGNDCYCKPCNSVPVAGYPPKTGGGDPNTTCPGYAVDKQGQTVTFGAACSPNATGLRCNTTTGNCN